MDLILLHQMRRRQPLVQVGSMIQHQHLLATIDLRDFWVALLLLTHDQAQVLNLL